jgi:hypothetical protein
MPPDRTRSDDRRSAASDDARDCAHDRRRSRDSGLSSSISASLALDHDRADDRQSA